MNQVAETPIFRPTWATIDLTALKHNYSVVQRKLGENVGIMAMVKADAYGHGAVPVSRVLEDCGVRALGVATVEEGMELRLAGIKAQILVMGGLMGAGLPASRVMVEERLTPVISSPGVLASLEAEAVKVGRDVPVHIKIDTGMSRLGVRPESLPSLISQFKQCPHLFTEGVMTHLAESDCEEISSKQMRLFMEARRLIEKELGQVRVWHVANSGAILRGEPIEIHGATECWARPGLALFGDANGLRFGREELHPVMKLESKVVLLKWIPEGARVSYCGTFTTSRLTRIAVVPIGYADGYPWSASGKAQVLIRGMRAPVIGRITMDMIIIDITDVRGVEVGDEAVLLGVQGDEQIALHDIARWAGTITYEILCGISKRMPRMYKK